MKKLFLLLSISLLAFSCESSSQAPSTGNPYELVVVTPADVFHGAVGDTLKNIFGEEVLGLNRNEPIFDMFNVQPSAMKTIAGKHRNLLLVQVNEKFTENEFYADTNVYAKGQLCIYFQGPNADSLSKYIYANRAVLSGLLNKYERDRFVNRLKKYNQVGLDDLIEKKFGFKMKIPQGYRVKSNSDNFLWLGFETTYGSLGVVIYTFDQQPTGENWLVDQRNLAVKNIPGPSDGSYMSTEDRLVAQTNMVDIYGRQWFQTRGLWMVKGDFMGGPFISFVTYADGRYVAIDCFVQEPDTQKKHRNYIRQFEALPLTVEFPTEKETK